MASPPGCMRYVRSHLAGWLKEPSVSPAQAPAKRAGMPMNACTPHPCMRGDNYIGSYSSRMESLQVPPWLEIEQDALGIRQRPHLTLRSHFLRLSERVRQVFWVGKSPSGMRQPWVVAHCGCQPHTSPAPAAPRLMVFPKSTPNGLSHPAAKPAVAVTLTR